MGFGFALWLCTVALHFGYTPAFVTNGATETVTVVCLNKDSVVFDAWFVALVR
jgi:hypothetical protein